MPGVFDNNKFWERGNRLNQKRHFDLTKVQKANIALCTGSKQNHLCKNPIFRCSECGNFGCDQEVKDKCDAQAFKCDKCLKCGAVGSRVPVMKQEYEQLIAERDKKMPVVE